MMQAKVKKEWKALSQHRASVADQEGLMALLLILATFVARIVYSDWSQWRARGALVLSEIAQNIVSGNGFAVMKGGTFSPVTTQDPVYPLFLAGIYSLFGTSTTPLYLFQILLSAFTGYFIYLLAKQLFGRKVAIASLAAYAIYLPIIVYTGQVAVETVYIFLIVLTTYLSFSVLQRGLLVRVLTGIVAGLSVLTRSDALPYLFLVLAVAVLLTHRRRQLLQAYIVILLAFLATIIPWVGRNYLISGRIGLRDTSVLLSSLYLGTGQHTFADPTYRIFFEYPSGPPPDLRAQHQQNVLTAYFHDVQADPIGYIKFRANQLVRMWSYGSQGVFDAEDIGIFELLRMGRLGEFGFRMTTFLLFGPIMIILALVGAVNGIRVNRFSALLLVMPLYSTILVLPLYVDYRYGLAAQVIMLPLIGLGAVALFRRRDLKGSGEVALG